MVTDLHYRYLASRPRPAYRAASAVVLFVCAAVPPVSRAQVYVGQTADKGVLLSNFASQDAPQLLIAGPRTPEDAVSAGLAEAPVGKAARASRLPLPPASAQVRQMIDAVALKVGISADLLHAVIAAESGYNSRAVSPRGAIGLMQLLPATAKRFGVVDLLDPEENVLAGANYLKWLMVIFQNDLELVLAAYNAGERAVVKAGRRIPPYAETQAYVPRVLAYLRCAPNRSCTLGKGSGAVLEQSSDI